MLSLELLVVFFCVIDEGEWLGGHLMANKGQSFSELYMVQKRFEHCRVVAGFTVALNPKKSQNCAEI